MSKWKQYFNKSKNNEDKLVIIDGINFFFRGSFGERLPSDSQRLFTFVTNLSQIAEQFKPCTVIVCWDGGYRDRLKLSEKAVAAGIVPKTYKQDRRDKRKVENTPEESEAIIRQIDLMKSMISYTRIYQVTLEGEEADDIAGTICKRNHADKKVILVTSDRDYYQLLWDNVEIFNSMNNKHITALNLKTEYGLNSPREWIEACVLAGDSSDTIYGVRGIGLKTACQLIANYGTVKNIINKAENIFSDELKNGYDNFVQKVLNGEMSGKTKYLKEAKVLASKEIIDLGFKLKTIKTDLDFQPEQVKPNWRELEEFLLKNHVNISQNKLSALLTR